MKGFSERALVSDVLNWLRRRPGSTGSEVVVAAELLGRILEDAVIASIDVPSFDRSAMDGYAVQAESTDGASLYNPLTFSITGQAFLRGASTEGISQSLDDARRGQRAIFLEFS